jgi:8-oxo-dGTP pyrophosphatase MutT (NUDIX family)
VTSATFPDRSVNDPYPCAAQLLYGPITIARLDLNRSRRVAMHDDVEPRSLGVERSRLHAVVQREPRDVNGIHVSLAQQPLEIGFLKSRVALQVGRSSLVDDHVDLVGVHPRVQSGAGLSCTQWTGHGPPLGANEPWSAGCQSRVATTNGMLCASRLIGSTTASPSATASAPPGQKSFWTSITSRASIPPEYSQAVASRTHSTARALRRVLLTVDEALTIDVRGRTDAAVLVPLYESGGEFHVVFTKRRDDLRRHPGEISFPGGRYEQGERDLLATALREAEEEIGLPADAVEVIGALQPTPTIATGYAVYPFVGMIEPGRAWTPSAGEVADVLELSFPELLAGYARRRLVRRGLPLRTDTYLVDEHLIWGATARILADLFDRISDLPLLDRRHRSTAG